MVACAILRTRPVLAAWLSYALLALWFVAPVLGDPTHLALGHPGNDVGNHVWGYGWVEGAVAAGALPVHTSLLSWPVGGALWFIDVFDVLLTLPLGWLGGPTLAYNAGCLFNFWLAGVGAYVLAAHLGGGRRGAWLAGLSFMATPQLLGQAYNGISETLAVGWLPLALWAWLRAQAAPGARSGALAGLMLATCTLFNWYYGLFAMLCVPVLALTTPRGGGWRARALALLAAGATFAAVAGPPFTLFAASMQASDALVTRDPSFVWRTLVLHNMTDLLAMVHPGRFYSPDLAEVSGESLIVVVYVGYALLIPALVGAMWGRPRGAARPWVVAAATFFLLALGPFLYVDHAYTEVLGGWLPLPFLALFKFLPMFSRISHAYRFVVGLSLALSMLAALGVRAAEARGWDVALWVPTFAAARVLETCFFSSAVFPLVTTEVRAPSVLVGLDGGAVLDLPVGVPILARSQFLLGQLVHHQPVPFGLNEPTPPFLYANHYTQYLLELERSQVALLPARAPMLDLVLGRAALVDLGLRWIVVHEALYQPAQLPRVEQFLDLTATPLRAADGLRVYRLDPTVRAVAAAGE